MYYCHFFFPFYAIYIFMGSVSGLLVFFLCCYNVSSCKFKISCYHQSTANILQMTIQQEQQKKSLYGNSASYSFEIYL